MKKSILGCFIGFCVVWSLDSFSRVLIAHYHDQSILMFSYSDYPGVLWAILLTLIAGISTFLGGLFSFTYGKSQQILSLSIFTGLIILFRYAQIHLLYETETIFYPVTGLILSLLAIYLAWKLVRPDAELKRGKMKDEEFKQHHPVDQSGA
jgi:hypothetical protein